MEADNLPSAKREDTIRVFIADSTRMGNELLASALQKDEQFCVMGTAETVEKTLAGVRERVDVVIVGGDLGGPSAGLHLTRRLLATDPRLRIVTLLQRSEPQAVVEAFRAGAKGVFYRAEPIDGLWKCIERVHRGKVWVDDEAIDFVLQELANSTSTRMPAPQDVCLLTDREQRIVHLVTAGLTNRQIAFELNLNQHTLKHCLERLFEKLQVSSRTELVFAASAQAYPRTSYPVMLEEYAGTAPDDQTRFQRYSRAAEHPLPFAQLTLAEMHLQGSGTPKDIVGAFALFLVAEENSKRIIHASRAYREWIVSGMSEDQLLEARRMASQWLNKHRQQGGPPQLNGTANHVRYRLQKGPVTRLKRVC